MRFEFATATRIVFGPGTRAEVAPFAHEFGRRPLMVTGRSGERAAVIEAELPGCVRVRVEGEPTVQLLQASLEHGRKERCDVVVAVGGGSAIDLGKAIAALLTNPGSPLDYLEVIGKGKPLSCQPAPFIAVPTTAGTGAEVTRNAVLGSPEHRVKASLRSPLMLPRLAVIDPELTFGLPPDVTASTGLDALTQLIEPYVSTRANPMTDLWCQEGLRRVARSLECAYSHLQNLQARTDMAFASLLGGLSLANAGLGVVHGFAAPLGGMFPAPHGAICAALLPHGMEANIRALQSRAADSEALRRYAAVAQILTGESGAAPETGVDWVKEICRRLRIPPLRSYGVSEEHANDVIEKALNASSMKANPLPLEPDELRSIFIAAL